MPECFDGRRQGPVPSDIRSAGIDTGSNIVQDNLVATHDNVFQQFFSFNLPSVRSDRRREPSRSQAFKLPYDELARRNPWPSLSAKVGCQPDLSVRALIIDRPLPTTSPPLAGRAQDVTELEMTVDHKAREVKRLQEEVKSMLQVQREQARMLEETIDENRLFRAQMKQLTDDKKLLQAQVKELGKQNHSLGASVNSNKKQLQVSRKKTDDLKYLQRMVQGDSPVDGKGWTSNTIASKESAIIAAQQELRVFKQNHEVEVAKYKKIVADSFRTIDRLQAETDGAQSLVKEKDAQLYLHYLKDKPIKISLPAQVAAPPALPSSPGVAENFASPTSTPGKQSGGISLHSLATGKLLDDNSIPRIAASAGIGTMAAKGGSGTFLSVVDNASFLESIDGLNPGLRREWLLELGGRLQVLDHLSALLRSILRSVQSVSSHLKLSDLVEAIASQCAQLAGAERGVLMIVDSKKHDLWTYLKRNKPSNGFRAHDLSDDSALETYEWRIPISSGKGIMPSVANSGESINVPDVKSEARYAGLYDRHVGSEGVFVTQSLICTPVFDAAGNIVAVLQLMNKVAAGVGAAPNSRPDSNADSLATAFSKDDEIVLQSMNKIVGAILPNALEHNGLDTAFTNAETIRGVFHSLLCNSFLYDQVDAISKGACTLVGADECTIYLVDALSGQLVVHLSPDDIKVLNEAVESGATTVPPGSELMAKGEVRMPLGTSSGLPGHVGVAGDSYAVGNALLDRHIHSPTHWRTGTKMETVLCIPIYNSRHIVSGVLELVNKHGGGSPFATDDEHLLQSLVVPSGIFLENYASLRAVSSEAEQMQTKLSNLNHIIFTIDASGRLLKCNKPVELQSLCGDTIKGMQSSGIESWIDRGDSKSLFREDIRAVLGTKTHVWANDFCLTGADGVAEHINYMVKRIRKAASDVSEAEVLITIEKMSSDPDRSLQEALYRRLPHEIAHRATAEPHLGAIGPTTALRCHATLVYIDLLNVNSVTEGIPEDQSVKLMNKYVQSVSATIRQEGGFIAGMNANTMLAAFGVPFASEQDSLSACRAALEVNQCVQRLNRVLLPSQGSFVVAMAIHTGQMLWGGIRDDKSADYCVFGQTVNTVTSLFDVCKRGRKEYMGRPGGSAVLTGATFAEVQTRLVARELDLVAVPSQTELVALYELLGESESEVSAQLLKALPFYNFAIQDYRSSKFSQAQSKFQKVLSVYAGDVAANHYKERCLALLERPERKEWDVVWTGKEHTTLDLLVGNI